MPFVVRYAIWQVRSDAGQAPVLTVVQFAFQTIGGVIESTVVQRRSLRQRRRRKSLSLRDRTEGVLV